MLFDESTLRKLNQITLVAARVRAGVMKGERRSTRRGTSIEFADYRDYVPGDDLRRLDWNIYARLDRPFIKLLEEEEDLSVHILLDASRSMDWGLSQDPHGGDQHKFRYAQRLAGALGAIALGAGDRLAISALHSPTAPSTMIDQSKRLQPTAPASISKLSLRGSHNLFRLLSYLETLQPTGQVDLPRALRDYSLAAMRPGLAFLISDLFTTDDYFGGLNQLVGRGYEVTVLHVLCPEELDPPLSGDLRLVDIESGSVQEVSLDADLRDLYRNRLHSWQNDIRQECQRRGIRYIPVSTALPWDQFVLFEMRKAGVVK